MECMFIHNMAWMIEVTEEEYLSICSQHILNSYPINYN